MTDIFLGEGLFSFFFGKSVEPAAHGMAMACHTHICSNKEFCQTILFFSFLFFFFFFHIFLFFSTIYLFGCSERLCHDKDQSILLLIMNCYNWT